LRRSKKKSASAAASYNISRHGSVGGREKTLPLQQLDAVLRAPVASIALSYGALKLHPLGDPFHGDPRFEKIVASQAPKERH